MDLHGHKAKSQRLLTFEGICVDYTFCSIGILQGVHTQGLFRCFTYFICQYFVLQFYLFNLGISLSF